MDIENIKKAFNDFEDDKFTDSSNLLRKEIKGEIDGYLKKKLNLKKDDKKE